MTTLVIRSNADTVTDVFVGDMGFFVPQAGGTELFIDVINLQEAAESDNLRALTSDGVFPGGGDSSSNTLILNDGTKDIPVVEVDVFLGNLVDGNPPRVYNEALTGAINGTNKVFTVASKFVPGAEEVLFNGATQTEGVQYDYVRSDAVLGEGHDTIEFAVAPRSRPSPKGDDSIRIHYDPV